MDMENQVCENCKREIEGINFTLHTTHCSRFFTLCRICIELVPKHQFEEHQRICNTEIPKGQFPPVCGNCNREIAIENFILHATHCRRFLKLCRICNEPVPKCEFEEHQNICSTQISNCESSEEIESLSIASESSDEEESLNMIQQQLADLSLRTSTVVETIRPSRSSLASLPTCRYCFLGLPEEALKEHEYYCGSRTDICEGCGKRVILKDLDLHISTDCFPEEPQPSTSRVNPPSNGKGNSKKKKKGKKNKRRQ